MHVGCYHMIQLCVCFEKYRVSTQYFIVWNKSKTVSTIQCLQRTTRLQIVLGNIQLVGQSADVLVGHRQPPRCLVQISLKPMALISLLGDFFT